MSDLTDERQTTDDRLSRVYGIYHRIDGAIFAAEAGIVTAATVLMTLFIFLDLTFSFLNGIKIKLFPSEAVLKAGTELGGVPPGRMVAAVLALVLVLGLVIGGVRTHPRLGRGPRFVQVLAVAGVFAAVMGLAVMLVSLHPRWTCLTLTTLGAAYSAIRLLAGHRRGAYGSRALATWLVTFGLLFWFSASVPDRYSSWAQPYALFLLLWIGFIGASMATSQARHLRIDAVRRAVPRRHLGLYNFVSYLVAALFTGIFCYLAFRYTAARVGAGHAAGEIPDWLKVLAIPVSLLLMSLRFLSRSVLCLMGHADPAMGEVILPPPGETDKGGQR